MEDNKSKIPSGAVLTEHLLGSVADVSAPRPEEVFGKNSWIDFGVNNLFPQEVIDLYLNASGLFKSLVDRKAAMIAGNGFIMAPEIKEFIENKYGPETLNEIAFKCAIDIVLFGGYYLTIHRATNGAIGAISHLPYEKVRIEKPDEDGCHGFYISSDWVLYKKGAHKPYFMPAFDIDRNDPEQVMFVKTYTPGFEWYTLPDWIAIKNWVYVDRAISVFHKKNLDNGLSPSFVCVHKNQPPKEARDAFAQKMDANFAGATNAGKVINVYAESPELVPEFIPIELNGTDKRFQELVKQVDGEIVRGLKFTQAVAGLEIAGKLGSSNEINEQLEMFNVTVIEPLQRVINDNFNYLASINGFPQIMKLQPYEMFKTKKINREENAVVEAQNQVTLRSTKDGVAQMLSIITSFNKGAITREQAIIVLVDMYGYAREKAETYFPPVQPTTVPNENN